LALKKRRGCQKKNGEDPKKKGYRDLLWASWNGKAFDRGSSREKIQKRTRLTLRKNLQRILWETLKMGKSQRKKRNPKRKKKKTNETRHPPSGHVGVPKKEPKGHWELQTRARNQEKDWGDRRGKRDKEYKRSS